MKNKIKNILIILILIISIAGIILPRHLSDLDEIWNYNFARCIKNGLLPYKDFNMIQTPLLPIICGIFLKLTIDELIMMRIISILLITIVFFMIYKILEILRVDKKIIILSMIGLFFLSKSFFCLDYNYSVLLITLILIYLEIKNDKPCVKKDFLIGILAGTSFLFKQTTGLALILVFIFYKLLLAENKEDFKKVFKTIIYRLIGVLIPLIVLVLYLTINHIWSDFINYTILSLKTFSNKMSYVYLLKGDRGRLIQILSILIPITIIVMYFLSVVKKHKGDEQGNIFILFCYSFASFVVAFPISDKIHFIIGSTPTLIALVYLISILIANVNTNQKIKAIIKHFLEALCFLLIVYTTVISIKNTIKYLKIANNYTNLEHFKYIGKTINYIEPIDEYIIEQNHNGKDVYILDSTASIIMIPLNKYNKDYDMFLKGNIGEKGERRTN